ncbi:hypothetical protein [Emticicia sp. C21]|uniref:hypothetical protein n=1 Tax=Emticicia sp. C21 TaxID=2302915 RepID=UPI000E357487|nr:hypothetical protein [Emticicia sp. C21]RFS17464.1 hypothetical protein D0T08_06715 [Emticicia sp. C21]
MKILTGNIRLSQPFRLFGMVCGLFLVTSIFVKGNSSNTGNERLNISFIKANQLNSQSIIFQDWESTLPCDFLSILSAEEEVDPTDESTGDESSESDFPLHISYFNYNFVESSFVSFNLSLQKRITIPFFLLHHSWKIPFNSMVSYLRK